MSTPRILLMLLALPLFAGCPAAHGPRASSPQAAPPEMVLIPGGEFLMGDSKGPPHERPAHRVTLKPFLLDRHEVTVGQFEQFVSATGYVTDAEKFGWSGVFDLEAGEWRKVDGATWRHPDGPDGPAPDPSEPVCQVSFRDAEAYARWAGKRLPAEAEFELAARGGLPEGLYPWGRELTPNGRYMANFWQGVFPSRNDASDGFLRRAPVCSYPPNGYGLCDIAGNVWEWTVDWFSPKGYPNPQTGEEKAIRGGSWLCSEDTCSGYRITARGHTPPDSGLNHLGFRCAKDP